MAKIIHDQQPTRPAHLPGANLVDQQPRDEAQNPHVQVGLEIILVHDGLQQQQAHIING